MNIQESNVFKKEYEKIIKDDFKKYTEDTFSENAIYKEHILPLKHNSTNYNGGFKGYLTKFLMNKMGAVSSRGGLFYEKRVIAVDTVVAEIIKLNPYGRVKQTSKIHKQEFLLPKGTMRLISKYSRALYEKESNFENFDSYLKDIFNYMLNNIDNEQEKITHDIDNIIRTKTGKIFILESKTKERGQNFDAFGDVGKTLETWACLTYQAIMTEKENSKKFNINSVLNEVSWDTISILYLMNDILEKDITSFKYFPVFSEEVYEKGGVIAVDTFYKFFYDVNYSDIVEVEEKLSKDLDLACLETVLYYGKILYEEGKMDFYPELLDKYLNSIKEI